MRRTLIVTGGSRGIGAGVVRAALRQGWRVCFSWSGNAEAAARLEADCADDAENLLAVRADAADARAGRPQSDRLHACVSFRR